MACLGFFLVRAQALLGAAVAAPDEPTDRLAFLSAPEVDTLLHGFNAAVLAPTELLHPERTLHGMLEHWAAIQPDAPALVYEARIWPLKPRPCKASCSGRWSQERAQCASQARLYLCHQVAAASALPPGGASLRSALRGRQSNAWLSGCRRAC